MAAQDFVPTAGALVTATAFRTAMASCVVHLYTDALGTPSPATLLADFTANEATYSGYAAQTIANLNTPILAPGTGYMCVSPLLQFAVTFADPQVTNMIRGVYVVDAAGNLRRVIQFVQDIPMEIVAQGIPFFLTWTFPAGPI